MLTLLTGGTRHPFSAEAAASGAHQHLVMNGSEVCRETVRRMTAAVTEVLGRIGRTAAQVALLVPHQANKRIIEAVQRALGVDEDRFNVNVEEYLNAGSASVPFALWEAHATGRIVPGDLVVLTACGAGFHWAAAVQL